ncbi:MAG TPA: DUF6580 family putative transport protein [Candidatus Angelobacter sp.]|nr:DUF6580 family putative transport protein [Candidatus Angelobacter sp.]
MIKNTKFTKKIILIIILIVLAVGWRIVNHNYGIAPNLELITTVSVLAAVIIGWQAALIVPITTMIISDLIIGNSSIFIFTWGSFALIGASAILLKKLNNKPKAQILYSVGFAAVASFVFFIITNFGVWAQGWYPATWAGLVSCFTMAIPFYRTMLIGNLILVPAAISIWLLVKARQTAKSLVVDTLVRD